MTIKIKKEEVIKKFGSAEALADVLHISGSAVSQWRTDKDGYLPFGRTLQIFGLFKYLGMKIPKEWLTKPKDKDAA